MLMKLKFRCHASSVGIQFGFPFVSNLQASGDGKSFDEMEFTKTTAEGV